MHIHTPRAISLTFSIHRSLSLPPFSTLVLCEPGPAPAAMMQERDREEKCTDHSHKDRVPSNNHLCALFAILDRMPSRMRLSSGHLIIALVLYLAVAGFNAIFAFPQLPTWYAGLTKPAFLPVDTFPLVMVVLFTYLLLGCSVFFIWHASCMNRHDQLLCLTLIIFTIILTGLWGYLFFGLKSPLMGVMISVLVMSMLIATMIQSVKVSFGAMLLLTVVVILTFLIAYTNYLIVQFNPSLSIFGT